MNIGFITTSRADFGIYLPLLKQIEESDKHNYFLFAGGMHMSERFGSSYKLIEEAGFTIAEKVISFENDDLPVDISVNMGKTLTGYSKIWNNYSNKLDLVFAMGDRYEMFAAAASIVPFNIPLAHLHGGESTPAAIDNKFRHALTSLASIHFTSHEIHAQKVKEITGSDENIHVVGAPGIDNLVNMDLYSSKEFESQFKFNLDQPFVLCTFHPETLNFGSNKEYAEELVGALQEIEENILCTLPNADTAGLTIREVLLNFEKQNEQKIKCVENLGQAGYLTAMKNAELLVGNTSSGIIEAASFNKPVVNVGNRQMGRLAGDNVIHVNNKKKEILDGIVKAKNLIGRNFENPYGNGNAASKILAILDEL
ncbi:MAG: UDP-N-acetylglucosamine 2-epimerase (hydrolyzing) [Bacteroidetes bacterium]|nr:UDP-N-acetylglucosamine 2-epimerase (hydrolyzing) [Bacteroidota bacterium]